MTGVPNGPEGVVHRRSSLPVEEAVNRLVAAIEAAGAKVFTIVDHSGEAEAAGLRLRDTKLIIFGNPEGGTPVMDASPTAALDLPLKLLVWADDERVTRVTYLAPSWLAERHGLPEALVGPLGAVERLAATVTES